MSTKSDLIACLGAFENEVVAPVMAHQTVISKYTAQTAKTGASLACRAMEELEKGVAKDLADLTTDVAGLASTEQLSKVRALFSATAGCMDTVAGLIDSNIGTVNVMAHTQAVDTMRQSSVKARAMAQSLNAVP